MPFNSDGPIRVLLSLKCNVVGFNRFNGHAHYASFSIVAAMGVVRFQQI